MPSTVLTPVSKLTLDLSNFRTPAQKSESAALKAMVAVNPKAFWGLAESLLDSGYFPTENVIVLKAGRRYIVKEGNRRVAAIKLALGKLKSVGLDIPDAVQKKLSEMTAARRTSLRAVPCAVFAETEGEVVDRIVAMTHGKGDSAARTPWNAVARARHNRDQSKGFEPGLDLLERYLEHGQNLTAEQSGQWGGDYPLTVLDEAIQKVYPRTDHGKAAKFVAAYPAKLTGNTRSGLESLLYDIGTEKLSFAKLRITSEDTLAKYGFPNPVAQGAGQPASRKGTAGGVAAPAPVSATRSQAETDAAPLFASVFSSPSPASPSPAIASLASPAPVVPGGPLVKAKASSLNDPKSVRRALKELTIRGKEREKVVTLRDEAVAINIENTPYAFCFLLRSIVEISAKAFSKDHGIAITKPNGNEKSLVEILREVAEHMQNSALTADKKEVGKLLHGAMTELADRDRVLSVNSLNQLVHNPRYAVNSSSICTLFHNIAPLLEAMNK